MPNLTHHSHLLSVLSCSTDQSQSEDSDQINKISLLLGGSKWQDQLLVGKQKLVDLSNKDCLDRLLQLIEKYDRFSGSVQEPSGLCNSDILESISRTHANRTNHPEQWITKWNQLSTLQPSDYRNAIFLLQKKMKGNCECNFHLVLATAC